MAVSAKVGAFNIGTGAATTTVAVTGVGFQPKALIFWWSGLTTTSTGDRATHLRGMGWATSSSNFGAVCSRDEDAIGTAAADSGCRTDACIVEQGDGAFVGWADLVSMDSDGFTLEIIDQFATDLYVTYLAIGGDSITNAECGVFTAVGTAPVNQTVNNSGNFTPSVTLFLSDGAIANAPVTRVDSNFMFGAAVDSSSECVLWAGANDAGATMAAGSYVRAGECIAMNTGNPANSPDVRGEFVSHNASPGGFTVNWLERLTNARVLWCSIAGGDWAVGNLLTRTDTADITVSGLASQPAAMLFVSGNKAETTQDAAGGAHDEWSMGAATSTTERAVQHVASRNGNTDSFVFRTARTDAVYVNADPANASYTLEGLMDLSAVTSDGFTCVMDDTDPSAMFAWYVAVGPAPAGGSAKPWLYRSHTHTGVAA
jgi:hypothetical protein